MSLSERPIGQSEQRVELSFVLGDAAVADLAAPKLVFADVECMLAPRSRSDLCLLGGLAHLIQAIGCQRSALVAPHGDIPVQSVFYRFATLFSALMARIAKYIPPITMQQVMGLGNVGHVGGRALQASELCPYENRCRHAPSCQSTTGYFFAWCISGSRALSRFLVNGGAVISVAPTIVRSGSIGLPSARCPLIASKIRCLRR